MGLLKEFSELFTQSSRNHVPDALYCSINVNGYYLQSFGEGLKLHYAPPALLNRPSGLITQE